MSVATLIPLAHAGHWLWLLYVPPVLVVVISIVRTTVAERRAERREQEGREVRGNRDRQEPNA